MKSHIKIWKFEDAPIEYQKLSDNGGDEDWLAYIPKSFLGEFFDAPPNFIVGEAFGRCSTNYYALENKDIIAIGCHS